MSVGTTDAGPAGRSPAAWLLRALVRVYQWTLAPVLGNNCRFEPSCSNYALEALSKHGAVRGGLMAAWRILRCNPWGGAGWDPVPDAGNASARQADTGQATEHETHNRCDHGRD
ncbi:membrane protein insertion efficiency factor YidD [Skermanella sp. TT6]|uniref:Putative membrane protein insertion efficiency factor n=1 Tax=Skermanella cutis TaxID=2775420 RepID=A0ABX7B5K6_9PROT|nr:membrane protein insertion efficiency factor YidD [Skermanella sp. TT6]QQP88668.1 membrane protein insertion efficiency factor YidD [Skermanella sp. TT6]